MIGVRKSAAQKVSDLLARQREALLAGDLNRLSPMATDLEAALGRLKREGARRGVLESIQREAARNADLLKAAQSGVAQAQAHLNSARNTDLSTYDAQGRSRANGSAPSRTLARG